MTPGTAICPACQAEEVGVVDSRPSGGAIRRRRRCNACQYRWSTIEIAVCGSPGDGVNAALRDTEAALDTIMERLIGIKTFVSSMRVSIAGAGDGDGTET